MKGDVQKVSANNPMSISHLKGFMADLIGGHPEMTKLSHFNARYCIYTR